VPSTPSHHGPFTLLVTGGAGFIGSNLVRFVRAARPTWRVINLDALAYSGNLDNLADLASDPMHEFVRGDVRDRALLDVLMPRCDAVIHAAAESHVDRSIIDARPFVESNVTGTQAVLDAARASARTGGRERPPRVVFVSTDEVYGSLPLDRPDLRFREDSPMVPSSPYAASKAGADLLCHAAYVTHGQDVVVTRCSNNFGPFQFPEKVIPLFVTNLLRGKRVPLYGDGLNVRDWIHVEDHCEALLAVLERGRAGGVYNIGASNEQSNMHLTHALLHVMGMREEMIERVPDRLGHDRRYALDASKIERELGWRASRSAWPAALHDTVRWYREHRAWWERIMRGEHRAELPPMHPSATFTPEGV
jgi:dTDP-glucose 4,6-dehydratase